MREVIRQSEQWGFHRAARQAVNPADLQDLLGGKRIQAGYHARTAGEDFNVPRQAPMSDHVLDQITNPLPQNASHSEYEMRRRYMRPGELNEPITGGPNTWARDQKGAPPGNRGLDELEWAATAPGFDLERDGYERSQQSRDYAREMLQQQPWTKGEERYHEGPTFEQDNQLKLPGGAEDMYGNQDLQPWSQHSLAPGVPPQVKAVPGSGGRRRAPE